VGLGPSELHHIGAGVGVRFSWKNVSLISLKNVSRKDEDYESKKNEKRKQTLKDGAKNIREFTPSFW
jgi:hypothetical protein